MFMTACAAKEIRENVDMQDESHVSLKAILDLKGNVLFSEDDSRFITVFRQEISVYDAAELTASYTLENSGQFRWYGGSVFFVRYSSFISDHNWMNTGDLCVMEPETGRIVVKSGYLSHYDTGEEGIVYIDLGSLYFLPAADGVYGQSVKLINGFCIKAFLFGDMIAVYRRRETDSVVLLDMKGKEFDSIELAGGGNKWLPDMSFSKADDNRFSVSPRDGYKIFSVDGRRIEEAENERTYADTATASGVTFFTRYDDGYHWVYMKDREKEELLIKKKDTVPLGFSTHGNIVTLRWSSGTTLFFLDENS